MLLVDILPYVLVDVAGCPDILATNELRLAAIEFCKRSLAWKQQLAEVDTISGTASYAYAAPAGAAVARLEDVSLDGQDISVVTPAAGRDMVRRATGDVFAYGGLATLTLNPVPAESGKKIIAYCSLMPSMAATSIPDELAARYVAALAAGAVARIKAKDDRDYTDKAGGLIKQGEFEAGIAEAISDAASGASSAYSRTVAAWM